MSLFGYIRLIRPGHAVFAVIAVVVGAYAAIVLGTNAGFGLLSSNILFAGLVAFLVMSGGFIVNNYFDVNIDKANGRSSPIPGEVLPKRAFIVGYGMLTLGVVLCAATLNALAFTIALLAAFLVDLYSRVLKRYHTAWGNLVTSVVTAAAFLFGWAAVLSVPTPELSIALASMFSITLVATLGREFIKGIDDLEGDRPFGIRGVAARIGVWRTALFSLTLAVIAAIITPIPYVFGAFRFPYLVGIGIADALVVGSAIYFLVKIRGRENAEATSIYAHTTKTWILVGMAVAILSFWIGLI